MFFPVSLVSCFPFYFLIRCCLASVTLPPCYIQSPCVLVLVFCMFSVFLTSRFRSHSVFSLTLGSSLDLIYWYSDHCLFDFCWKCVLVYGVLEHKCRSNLNLLQTIQNTNMELPTMLYSSLEARLCSPLVVFSFLYLPTS